MKKIVSQRMVRPFVYIFLFDNNDVEYRETGHCNFIQPSPDSESARAYFNEVCTRINN